MPAYNFLPAMRKKGLPPPPTYVKIIHQTIILRNHSVEVKHVLDAFMDKYFGSPHLLPLIL